MTDRRCRRGLWAAVGGIWLLSACQPLPHPFADDKPPPGLLTVRDSVSVLVAPIEGEPRATAAKLGPAMARALLQHEIPASDKTTSLGSYELLGMIRELPPNAGKVALVAHWQLRDAKGATLGEKTERLDASAQDWQDGNDDTVSQLAGASAEQLASLLQDDRPVEASVGGRTRLLVRHIEGAVGDGGQSLATAITAVLRRQDIELVSDPKAAADLFLDADVAVAAPKAGKQHVKIVWHVRRPDGSEIGTVGEENDVPTGMLDGPWGDVAYMVAVSAQNGIMALVDRGAPSPAPTGKS